MRIQAGYRHWIPLTNFTLGRKNKGGGGGGGGGEEEGKDIKPFS